MIEAKPNTVLLENFPPDARNTKLFYRDRNIVLTDEYQNEPSRLATVVAVGKNVIEPEVGWIVFCNRYPTSAQSFKYEGREFVSVAANEVLARIEVLN